MKSLRWNAVKSERLKRTRGASFEEVITSRLIAIKRHSQRDDQAIMLFDYRGYIWVVPYVESNDEIFLKTLYPSRKYTKARRQGRL